MRRAEKWLSPVLSVLLSVAIGALVILLCGYNPLQAFQAMFKGAFGKLPYVLNTLEKSMPLIFCGLAAAVAMKSGMFNIGAEGQVFVGALGYTLVALFMPGLPGVLHVLLGCVLAAVFGAVWALPPALLKLKNGTNEVVSAIMMNYIAKLLVAFLVSGPLMAPGDVAQSEAFPASAVIREIVPGSKVTWAFVLAMAACCAVWLLMNRTATGFNIAAAGMNARAAEAGGVNTTRVRIGAMVFSGVLAGLAGGLIAASSFGRLVEVVSTGYGFEGISIAVLGQFSAIGIVLASLLFGALHTGGLYMEMFVGIPTEINAVLQGVMIVVIASPLLLQVFYKPMAKRRKAA